MEEKSKAHVCVHLVEVGIISLRITVPRRRRPHRQRPFQLCAMSLGRAPTIRPPISHQGSIFSHPSRRGGRGCV